MSGSDAANDRQGSVARSTLRHAAHRACDQVAGASNRSPHVHGGHTHAPMGPPTRRPGHAGAATRGGGGGGRVRGAACVLDAPPPLRAAVGASCSQQRLRAERKFFCWSLPGHLPLRPDAPDAQNALSGKMVTKSRLSGKMVIPPITLVSEWRCCGALLNRSRRYCDRLGE